MKSQEGNLNSLETSLNNADVNLNNQEPYLKSTESSLECKMLIYNILVVKTAMKRVCKKKL